MEGTSDTAEGEGAAAQITFPERTIESSKVTWQALAAVIDGMNDEEAAARLEALNPEELRSFHFELDRIRTITRNVRFRKMRDADLAAKEAHESSVKKTGKAREA